MIIAIVSPSETAQDFYIRQVMASTTMARRFCVAPHVEANRGDVLLTALRRDAKNCDSTTLVPVTSPAEVEAIRLMGGFVGHIYGLAHASIAIRPADLMLVNPLPSYHKGNHRHHIRPDDLPSELRTRLLAVRMRHGRH